MTATVRTAAPAKPRPGSSRTARLVFAGLLLLSAVPLIAGAVRVGELAGGAEVTAANARFVASPIPVLVHILAAVPYCLLGAAQFLPGFRRRRPGWHRVAGRLLVPCGLVVAGSGLWMTMFYARPADTGDLISGVRLVVGSAMLVSILLGVAAIRRRDIARHSAWMIRGYALAQGAGTQVLTQLPWMVLVGPLGQTSKAVLMTLGWLINLAVAEWVIRCTSVTRPRGRAG